MKKTIFFVFISYTILILGFFLNADPNGGAFNDYINHIRVIKNFSNDFHATFYNYDQYATRHSPVLYIIISLFYKIGIPDQLIRFFSVHFALLLPFIFYKCLLIKFPKINKEYLILCSCIILFSPTFWSLSIWPDSRLFGLIFFCLSIFYFLKFKIKKNFKNSFKCVLAYTLSSYLSPNFAVFSIFYFYFFFIEFRFNKEIFLIILINLIFALPAFLYLFSLDNLFILNPATPGGIGEIDSFNINNKILIISSILFFYLIPFIFIRSINLNFLNLKFVIFSILIVLFLSLNFNYNTKLTGGGIFLNASNYLFDNNLFFLLICVPAILSILNISKINKINILILLLILISNPQYTIYHKYYDPLIFILIILIFELKINIKKLFNYRSIMFFYLYSGLFLILNFFK
tara:strand:+ start:5416 stop:6627 length:1212 start_codon:yes stop_codon:yes gene_type:complete